MLRNFKTIKIEVVGTGSRVEALYDNKKLIELEEAWLEECSGWSDQALTDGKVFEIEISEKKWKYLYEGYGKPIASRSWKWESLKGVNFGRE